MTPSRSTNCRTSAWYRAGSPPLSPIRCFTAWQLMPPFSLISAAQADTALAPGANRYPTTPDMVPTLPMTMGGSDPLQPAGVEGRPGAPGAAPPPAGPPGSADFVPAAAVAAPGDFWPGAGVPDAVRPPIGSSARPPRPARRPRRTLR